MFLIKAFKFVSLKLHWNETIQKLPSSSTVFHQTNQFNLIQIGNIPQFQLLITFKIIFIKFLTLFFLFSLINFLHFLPHCIQLLSVYFSMRRSKKQKATKKFFRIENKRIYESTSTCPTRRPCLNGTAKEEIVDQPMKKKLTDLANKIATFELGNWTVECYSIMTPPPPPTVSSGFSSFF